jgi:hypothetical protein
VFGPDVVDLDYAVWYLIRTHMFLLARNVLPSLWQSSMKIRSNKITNHFISNLF